MSAGHFFVGLGAGIAILAVPVLTFTPGREIPQRVITWIEGPSPQVTSPDASVARPLRGYQPGEPTPGPESAPPTLRPALNATPTPTSAPVSAAQPFVPTGSSGMKTGVVRAGGAQVVVRRVAGVERPDDVPITDGSPVLVSTGAALQAAGQQWRAVRALGGVVGWVPSTQLSVDGEAAPAATIQVASTMVAPTASASANRGAIAHTDGAGVVLRNTPNDADRTHSGLMDGVGVTVLERAGADWVHVRADNGLTGWIPARYLLPHG